MSGKRTLSALVDTRDEDGQLIYKLTHPEHPEITVEGADLKKVKRDFIIKVRQALKGKG